MKREVKRSLLTWVIYTIYMILSDFVFNYNDETHEITPIKHVITGFILALILYIINTTQTKRTG